MDNEFDPDPLYDEHEGASYCRRHRWFDDSNLSCPRCDDEDDDHYEED